MKLDRRQFVTLSSLVLGSPMLAMAKGSDGALFLSAASDSDDRHWVMGFRENGNVIEQAFRHELPARAHHVAVNAAQGLYVVIARRPGPWLWIGDLATGKFLHEISLPEDRHLYGHGVFTEDGRRFYTTESDWQDMTGDSGRVSVWDVSRDGDAVSMTRTTEYSTHGVGPHELLLTTDEQTLVIANGGIRTHPDRGREKLNIDTMLPSLVYLDAGSGRLLEQQFLDSEYHQASIRHMDLNADGQVAFGMQYEGEPFHRIPLVATHRRGEPIRVLWAPEPVQGNMNQYVGSVRFDAGGRFFAASSPRGNMITIWDAESGTMQRTIRSRDGCGVCAADDGFLYTTGTGKIARYDLAADSITEMDVDPVGRMFWDNHLSMAES